MTISSVLLVDDDASIRRITQLVLTRLVAWEVKLADSGKEALDILVDYQPDLILLDVMMPGMDGPTTLNAIKQRYANAAPPVIFMTAKALKTEVELYLNLGSAGVITKPFDPKSLPDEIFSILEKWKKGRFVA
ncbi:MAG: response regulator [Candidatus Melainabacteria bacterium]|nr:response regulator [Candidatus Melainabacteria bacterium]